jgi:TRAP-type C4-dicarboxylate transport system substrate-binding protein
MRELPADLQAAIRQAGKDAGTFGRIVEVTEGEAKMAMMESEGKLKTVRFTERAKLIAAAQPVLEDYFKKLDAVDLYNAIQAVK